MINKKLIEKIKSEYDKHEAERRQIISVANNILHGSKRAIFSLHRDDPGRASELISEAEKSVAYLEEKFGYRRLNEEGSYKAGVEEYAEAKLFYQVLDKGRITEIKEVKLSYETYLGGICDLTGELVRRAINQAAAGKTAEALEAKRLVGDIMAELVMFDMTGYLRTKYDQAKTNLKKIEHIAYELKLRQPEQ